MRECKKLKKRRSKLLKKNYFGREKLGTSRLNWIENKENAYLLPSIFKEIIIMDIKNKYRWIEDNNKCEVTL